MKKYYFQIITIFIGVYFLECSAPKELEYRDYKNLNIQKLDFGTSRVTLNLQYYNPNNFGLQLRRTDLDIFINNNFLGHSTSDTLINIPRRDTFLLPIKFDLDMKNMFKNTKWERFFKSSDIVIV